MNVMRFKDKATGSVIAKQGEKYTVDYGNGPEESHCTEIQVIDDSPITPPVAPKPLKP